MNARIAATDRRKPAVLTDFDDTAAAQNVAELLLHEFGHPSWTDVRERFRAGELSLKDYQEATFLRMQANKDAMQSYVRAHANFRPHFAELSAFCRAHSIPMCIISQGLDFYIQALLGRIAGRRRCRCTPWRPISTNRDGFAATGTISRIRTPRTWATARP